MGLGLAAAPRGDKLCEADAQAGDSKHEEEDSFDEDRGHCRPPRHTSSATKANNIVLQITTVNASGPPIPDDHDSIFCATSCSSRTKTYRKISVEAHTGGESEGQIRKGTHHKAREEG